MNTRIKELKARQILDCKCRPIVEVDIITEDGILGRGCAPTGSSVGKSESFVLRDEDPKIYNGLGVKKAVKNIEEIIAPSLIGVDVMDQELIDQTMISMDGTEFKSNLGGNTIYSVSIASLRAAAATVKVPLYEYIAKGKIKKIPVPSFNVVNGGRYETLIQPFNEFIIMPYGAKNIEEAVEMGVLTFRELEKVLTKYLGKKPQVAPSYGYVSPSNDPEIILELMSEAVKVCGYDKKMGFALDCASSEMYDSETDTYLWKDKRITASELIAHAKRLSEKFDFVFIEDLLDEEDWKHYPAAHEQITRTNIFGDDFTVTNPKRLKKAYETKSIDGFILKPNQVGTVTEALQAYHYATDHNLIAVPSGRSGGVIGDVVMDLAVGLQVDFIKNGAPKSGERIDKLNFLIRASDDNPGCILSDISKVIKFR